METYTILREFADSWFLLAMFTFFIGTWVFAFWPSLQSFREEAAGIPFRDDIQKCTKSCETCSCKTDFLGDYLDG
ncbi:MAG: cbb3-type cytochrome c oxidase subunit 3 [Pseudomonadota bacterium]